MNRTRETATRIIDRYGLRATLVREQLGTLPFPNQPIGPGNFPTGGGPDLEYPVLMLETGYDEKQATTTLMQAGDLVGMMATSDDVTPDLTDGLRVGDIEYRFEELSPIAPDGLVVAYRFVARR